MISLVYSATNDLPSLCPIRAVVGAAFILAVTFCAEGADSTLRTGMTVEVGGKKARIERIEFLPHVESDYTRRFRFDTFENPKLTELRDRYYLEDVIAPGKDEFDRQVLLRDWVTVSE